MKTTIHNCQQGSSDWLKLREGFDTASEAPASQGKSKYTSRSELLKQKATGLSADVGAVKQALFDRGHASEESARSIAERLLDDDLYPITATTSVDGINLLASLDGATMDRKIIWEHKLYSEKLVSDVRSGNLDPHYTIQMDQQLFVTGAQKCMFMTSDGTEENMAWCWYESSQEKFDSLLAGWMQFRSDLATYTPEVIEAAPVGKSPETLPALHIEVTGMVTASNLAEYKAHALAVFASVNRELVTDQDFADAKKAIKWAGDIETRLQGAKQHALSQTESIDALFRTIDDISEEARRVRLDLNNMVKSRETTLKTEIVADGRNALADHVAACNKRIGRPFMPVIPADFAAAIKGMSKFENMRNAVATELSRAKIEANAIADKIDANLRHLSDVNAPMFLFSDLQLVCLKPTDDFQMLVKVRINDHAEKETARIAAETARIAEQERVKAEAAARARADAEIAAATEAAQAQAARASAEAIAKAQAHQFEELEKSEIRRLASLSSSLIVEARQEPVLIDKATADDNARAFIDRIESKPVTLPTLKLGVICARLGFQVTADFLKSLGFEPAGRERAAVLFHESDFDRICAALISHISAVRLGATA